MQDLKDSTLQQEFYVRARMHVYKREEAGDPLKLSAWGFVMIDGPVCPEIIFVQLVRKQPWRPCRVPITTACVNSVKHRSVNDDDDDDDDAKKGQRSSSQIESLSETTTTSKSAESFDSLTATEISSCRDLRYPLFSSLRDSGHVAWINRERRSGVPR